MHTNNMLYLFTIQCALWNTKYNLNFFFLFIILFIRILNNERVCCMNVYVYIYIYFFKKALVKV